MLLHVFLVISCLLPQSLCAFQCSRAPANSSQLLCAFPKAAGPRVPFACGSLEEVLGALSRRQKTPVTAGSVCVQVVDPTSACLLLDFKDSLPAGARLDLSAFLGPLTHVRHLYISGPVSLPARLRAPGSQLESLTLGGALLTELDLQVVAELPVTGLTLYASALTSLRGPAGKLKSLQLLDVSPSLLQDCGALSLPGLTTLLVLWGSRQPPVPTRTFCALPETLRDLYLPANFTQPLPVFKPQPQGAPYPFFTPHTEQSCSLGLPVVTDYVHLSERTLGDVRGRPECAKDPCRQDDKEVKNLEEKPPGVQAGLEGPVKEQPSRTSSSEDSAKRGASISPGALLLLLVCALTSASYL